MAGTPQNFGVGEVINLTDGATITVDNGGQGPVLNGSSVSGVVISNFFRVRLGGNRTFAPFANFPNGAVIFLKLVQDGTGSRTVTWNANVDWASGTPPTLTATANASDILEFVHDTSTGNWIGRVFALNIS